MRHFIKLGYNGAGFHGWQSQPSASSVQQTIENALSTVMRTRVSIVGAGRTDTGVHARRMYAHFDTEHPLTDRHRIIASVNRLVGRNIAIYDIMDVKPEAHARFDAVSREYRYFVSDEKSPFLFPLSWHSCFPLDYSKMNEAAALLLSTSDFTSFAKLHSDAKTNICNVTKAEWSTDENYGTSLHVFTICADRFLRNMVRAVVGTLVDVGRNKISVTDFQNIINKKDRCCAGTSMPPEALFLWDVSYPGNIFIP